MKLMAYNNPFQSPITILVDKSKKQRKTPKVVTGMTELYSRLQENCIEVM